LARSDKQTRREITSAIIFTRRPSSSISLHANMISLLCRDIHHLCSSFFPSTARAVATAGRAYYSSTADHESSPARQYATKYNEERARRCATDSEFRENILAYGKAWYQKNRLTKNAKSRAYRAQHSDKVQASLAAQRTSRDFEKLYYAPTRARWASDDQYRQRVLLRKWILAKPWVRDLTWQTHKPIVSEKIVRYCGGCKVTRSLKFWWQDKKTDGFLCHPCFTSDWSRALPIGYEDKVFGLKRRRSTKTTTGSKPGLEP
jgi:hypothetical protein